MSQPCPHLRFLVRGSLLLTAMLTLWWFALQSPLLFALRVAEEAANRMLPRFGAASRITLNDSGDWNFLVPASGIRQGAAGSVRVNSVEFTIPRNDVVLFTVSLPFFWALMLAAPDAQKHLYAVLRGTGLLAIVEVLLLLRHIENVTRSILAQWHLEHTSLWREFASYLITNVLPFLVPLVMTVCLQPALRSLVFPSRGTYIRRTLCACKRGDSRFPESDVRVIPDRSPMAHENALQCFRSATLPHTTVN